ncbi:hypothetical protein ONJ45_28405, partial [Salmonella enterica subsp. enterica serovar Virginia]|nr:hypothetical protein [Salmonella enterica subsp. enterica serovar Virginia]
MALLPLTIIVAANQDIIYGFYVDSSRCSGCKTCQVSCKDNKDLDVGPKLRRVYEYGGGS